MRVAIDGFGRFGRLLAALFKVAVGPDVELVATSRSDHSAAARELDVTWVSLPEAAAADVVVLCVPVRRLGAALDGLLPYLNPASLVMDTCSVKSYPAKLMLAKLPPHVAILATHPLFGPDGVRSFGIVGQRVVLCPVRVDEQRLALVAGWFRKLQVEIIQATPEEHDRLVAISQGLVHFVGRSIERAGLLEPALTTNNSSRLFELVRSVANDSPELFEDLEVLNPFAAEVRRTFLRAGQEIESELAHLCPDQLTGR